MNHIVLCLIKFRRLNVQFFPSTHAGFLTEFTHRKKRTQQKLFKTSAPKLISFIHSVDTRRTSCGRRLFLKFVNWIFASSLVRNDRRGRSSLLEALSLKSREREEKGKKKKVWNRQWPNQRIAAEKKERRRAIDARLNLVIGWALGRQYNRGPTECGVCFPAPLCSLVRYKGGEWTSEGFNAWREEYGH